MSLTLLILYAGLFIAGFVVRKSRPLTIVIMLYSWVLIGWNSYNDDYNAYEAIYNRNLAYMESAEPGYLLLNYFVSMTGLDYAQFRILMSGISILLFYLTIRRFAYYDSMTAACYLAFILILDVTQIRNFFAFSIVLFSIRYLLYSNIKGRIYYVLLVLLAATIHSASIFYLLFVFTNSRRINLGWIVVFMFFESIAVHFLPGLIGGYASDKFDAYNIGTSNVTMVVATTIQILNAYFIYLVGSTHRQQLLFTARQNRFMSSNMVVNLNIIMLLMIPFYSYTLSYMRVFRNIAVINFMYIGNALCEQQKDRELKMIGYGIYAAYFLILINFMHEFGKVFTPIFTYNSLID